MSIKLYDAEIEYLESTGTQYIDTLFYPRITNTDITVEVKFNKSVLNGGHCVLGARTGAGGNQGFKLPNFCDGTLECQGLTPAGSGTGGGNLSGTYSINTDYVLYAELKQNSQKFYVNDTLKKSTSYSGNCDAGGNLYLFAMHQSGTKWYFNGKIYYCKIWEDNVLVRNFIPVRVGNVGYLFDKVSMKLFGNSGTGSFVLGPDIAPGRYANEIAFLESTGSQYIQLPLTVSAGTFFEVDFDVFIDSVYSTNSPGLFGGTPDVQFASDYCSYNNNRITFSSRIGDDYMNGGYGIPVGKKTHVTVSTTGLHTYTDDEDITNKELLRSLTATLEGLRIFNRYTGSGYPCRIYNFKITVGNNVIYNLIPVEYNNIGYLYDKVSGEFFANQGTGKFVLGHRAPRFDGKACARSYTRRQLMADTVLPKPYISDGLVFHLDGADATDTTWVDRIGGNTFTNGGSATHNGKGVLGTYSSPTAFGVRRNVGTIEVCGEIVSSWGGADNTIAVVRDKDHIYGLNYILKPRETPPYAHISSRNAITAPMAYRSVGLGKFTHSLNIERHVFNGTLGTLGSNTYSTTNASSSFVGLAKVRIYQVRIYNRLLTEAEMKFNQEQDRKKYGIQF